MIRWKSCSVLLVLLFLHYTNSQRCSLSATLNKKSGIVTDGSALNEDYTAPMNCHWKIKTNDPVKVVLLEFEYLNLKKDYYTDFVMVNLGPDTDPGPGWTLYERDKAESNGYDELGSYSYEYSDKQTCIAGQGQSYNVYSCPLTYGSLLEEPSWADSWYYKTGKMESYEMTPLSSVGQEMYILFRALEVDSGGYDYGTADEEVHYGFKAKFSLGSAYCRGLKTYENRVVLKKGVYETSKTKFADNVKEEYLPGTNCGWLIAPKYKLEDKDETLFDAVQLTFKKIGLSDEKDKITIYEGKDDTGTVLSTIVGPMDEAAGRVVKSNTGAVFFTFTTDEDQDSVDKGFAVEWKALYCPEDCSGNGVCTNGVCVCNDEFEGPACNIPAGWTCLGTHYNTSDGCDCGCGLYDPDCGQVGNEVQFCTTPELLSTEGTLFNATKGQFFTGVCLYCPLPTDIPALKPPSQEEFDILDGTLAASCPNTFDCGPNEQCDALGTCLTTKGSAFQPQDVRKICITNEECPEFTHCNDNYCSSKADFGLIFENAMQFSTKCSFNDVPATEISVELWINPEKLSIADKILSFDDSAFSIEGTSSIQVVIDSVSAFTLAELEPAAWTHLVVIWNSDTGNLKTYTNGVLQSELVAGTGYAIPTNPMLKVGGFQGALKKLLIWNKILTLAEITASAGQVQTADLPLLKGHYRFIDGSLRDLSPHNNHLKSEDAKIDEVSISTGNCVIPPISPPSQFPVGSMLILTGEYNDLDILYAPITFYTPSMDVAFQVTLAKDIVRSASGTVDDSTGGSLGLDSSTEFQLQITRLANKFKLCVNGITCVEHSDGSNGGNIGSITFFDGNQFAATCFQVATSSAELVASLDEVVTFSGETCVFPVQYTANDCSKIPDYVDSLGINMADLVAKAKDEAENYDPVPCTCADTSTFPEWKLSITPIFVGPARVKLQITYQLPVLKDFSTDAFDYAEYSDCSNGAETCGISTIQGATRKTRDFTFIKDGPQFVVDGVSEPNNLSSERCGVPPSAAMVNVQVNSYECASRGVKSILVDETPFCFSAEQPGVKQICLSEKNACNLQGGSITLTATSGSLSDGYSDESFSDKILNCNFHLSPIISTALQPFARIKLTFSTLKLENTGKLIVLNADDSLVQGSPLTGNKGVAQLPVLRSSSSSVSLQLENRNTVRGTATNGFDLDYWVEYEFSATQPESLCNVPQTSIDFATAASGVYPVYTFNESWTPQESTCSYTLASSDATQAAGISSIWLNFLEFNLTASNGVDGDTLSIYEQNTATGEEDLVLTLSNESFVEHIWAVSFDGKKDYIVSDAPLVAFPRTVLFRIKCPTTITKDCTVQGNCDGTTAKAMKVLGTPVGTNYFLVELQVETGFLSITYSNRMYILSFDIRLDAWQHIAFVFHETEDRLVGYVNGFVQSVTKQGPVRVGPLAQFPDGSLFVGGRGDLPDTRNIFFEGDLAQIELHSDTKLLQFIEHHANFEASCQATSSSLLVCYTFEEKNYVALDHSANGNHVTLFGADFSESMDISTILGYTFASTANAIRLEFSPSSNESSANFRFVYEAKTCPTNCGTKGSCVRGICECQPGWTGDQCDLATYSCDAISLIEGSSGVLSLEKKELALSSKMWFPPRTNAKGYPPLNCTWQIMASRALVTFKISDIALEHAEDNLRIQDGLKVYTAHHDGLEYNLPANLALDLAKFKTREAFTYENIVFNTIAEKSMIATLSIAKAAADCEIKYHKFNFERHSACEDGTAVGLDKQKAINLAKTWWYELSDSAYSSNIVPTALFFNSFDSSDASISMNYNEVDLDGASTPQFPLQFIFKKKTTDGQRCKDATPLGLDIASINSIVNNVWPITGYSSQGMSEPFEAQQLVYLLPNVNLEAPDAAGLTIDEPRTIPYAGEFANVLGSSKGMTIIADVTPILTNERQVLLLQATDSDYGGMILSLSKENQKKGQWIFGKLYENEKAGAQNPTSISKKRIRIAITLVNGIIAYYKDGKLLGRTDSAKCPSSQNSHDYCPAGIASFPQNQLLNIGGPISSSYMLAKWAGKIHSIKMFDFVLSASEIAYSLFPETAEILPFSAQNAFVNTVDSTTAEVSIMHTFTVVVNDISIQSLLRQKFSFVKAGCKAPSDTTKADIISILNDAVAFPTTPSEEDIIINAFSTRKLAVSVKDDGTYRQVHLSRRATYDHGLDDEILVELISQTFREFELAEIYVNTQDANKAKVSVSLLDHAMISHGYVLHLNNDVNDGWILDTEKSSAIAAPKEDPDTREICSIDPVTLQSPVGSISDGSDGTMDGDFDCTWTIQAPPGDTISISFDRRYVHCWDGEFEITLDGSTPQSYCTMDSDIPPPIVSTTNTVVVRLTTSGAYRGTGFYLTYRFSSFSSTLDTSIASGVTFSDWELDDSPGPASSGSAVCSIGPADDAQTWKWTDVISEVPFDKTCYESEVVAATNEWECIGATTSASQACTNTVEDLTVPWSAVSFQEQEYSDLAWSQNSEKQASGSPVVFQKPTDNSVNVFQADSGTATVSFFSAIGGQGGFNLQYRTSKIFYVAPASYTPPDGSKGTGTRESPFTHTLQLVLANFTGPGDLIRLYPGRYEGAGYCNLKITNNTVIESLSGRENTLVDCLGSDRGWTLAHSSGTTEIIGIAFIGCKPAKAPMLGAAVLVSGHAIISKCIFFANVHTASGTVAVLLPGSAEIHNCIFKENAGTSGSAIAVYSAYSKITNCDFSNNWASFQGTVFASKHTVEGVTLPSIAVVIIEGAKFVENDAPVGADIAATLNTELDMSNTQLSNSESGVAVFVDNSTFSATDCSFSDIENGAIATNRGAKVEIYDSEFSRNSNEKGDGAAIQLAYSSAIVQRSLFSTNSVQGSGGAVSLSWSKVSMSESTFENNVATQNGGAIRFGRSDWPSAVNNCLFRNNQGQYGGAIDIENALVALSSNDFSSNQGDFGGGLSIRNVRDAAKYVSSSNNSYWSNNANSSGGAISVQASSKITMVDDQINNCNAIENGGGVALIDVLDGKIENSTILSNHANRGGGVYLNSKSLVWVEGSILKNCHSDRDGGTFSISDSILHLTESTIRNTTADLGGAISLLSQSTGMITSVEIYDSKASKGGSVYAVDSSVDDVSVNGLLISGSMATESGGGFYFALTNLNFKAIRMVDCNSRFGGAITMESSTLNFAESTFEDCYASKNGGAIYAITSTLVLDENSIFRRNTADSGAALYAFATNATVLDSAMQNNAAVTTGGGATLITSELTAENSVFSANTALRGGSLHADLSSVVLRSTLFTSNIAEDGGGAMYLQGETDITTERSEFRNNSAYFGGAAMCFQIGFCQFYHTVFEDNHANHSIEVIDDSGELVVDDEILESITGGALHFETIKEDSVLQNCSFIHNTARGDGGAMWLSLGKTKPLLHILDTHFSLNEGLFGAGIRIESSKTNLSNCDFVGQQAEAGGGGVFWTGVEPIGLPTSTYVDNVAAYGPNYGSIASEIVPVYFKSPEESGEPLKNPLVVLVVDQYGNNVTTDSSVQVQATAETPNSVIIGPPKAVSINGIVTFPGMGVRYDPGDNATFSVSAGRLAINSNISVHIRTCIRGEVQPDGLQRCVRCPVGEFSWNISDKVCHTCPEGAVCFGGDHIANQAQYWRFDNTTGVCDPDSVYDDCKFTKCLDPRACKGYQPSPGQFRAQLDPNSADTTMSLSIAKQGDLSSDYSKNDSIVVQGVPKSIISTNYDTGTDTFQIVVEKDEQVTNQQLMFLYKQDDESCEERFTGNACRRCAKGYSRSGKTDCSKCSDNFFLTYLVLFIGFFAAAAVSVIMIKMTIAKSRKKKDLMSIMTKIFTSYMQLVSLASSFKLNWPAQVVAMFETQEKVGSPAGDQLISIECVFDKHSSEHTTLPIYYQKLAFFMCLPVIACVIPILFWSWRYLVHRARHIRSWSWKRLKIEDTNNGNVSKEQLEDVIYAAGDVPSDILHMETTRIANLEDGPQPLDKVKNAFIQAKKGEMHDKAILSIIVLVFLLHPNLTKQILQIFTCSPLRMQEDNNNELEYFLTADMDISCSDSFHQRIMFFVGIPALLLYTFGIPGFAFIILYQRRHQLADPRVKLQFGFLYDGYEHEYFFWELWVMIRKVLIIFVSVFLSRIGVASQSLGATGITFLALYMHLRAMPYEEPKLDQLEQFSLLTSLFTLYCGLFFFHDEIGFGGRIALVVIIFIANARFLQMFIALIMVEVKAKANNALGGVKAKLFKNKEGKVSSNEPTSAVIPLPDSEETNLSNSKAVMPLVHDTDDIEEIKA